MEEKIYTIGSITNAQEKKIRKARQPGKWKWMGHILRKDCSTHSKKLLWVGTPQEKNREGVGG
jgi:hypothetical protein